LILEDLIKIGAVKRPMSAMPPFTAEFNLTLPNKKE